MAENSGASCPSSLRTAPPLPFCLFLSILGSSQEINPLSNDCARLGGTSPSSTPHAERKKVGGGGGGGKHHFLVDPHHHFALSLGIGWVPLLKLHIAPPHAMTYGVKAPDLVRIFSHYALPTKSCFLCEEPRYMTYSLLFFPVPPCYSSE